MRNPVDKLRKVFQKTKIDKKDPIQNSREYKAMIMMNLILTVYTDLEQIGYDPLEGEETYINARFSANAFMEYLITTLDEKFPSNSIFKTNDEKEAE